MRKRIPEERGLGGIAPFRQWSVTRVGIIDVDVNLMVLLSLLVVCVVMLQDRPERLPCVD